jgi:hypothetical protein
MIINYHEQFQMNNVIEHEVFSFYGSYVLARNSYKTKYKLVLWMTVKLDLIINDIKFIDFAEKGSKWHTYLLSNISNVYIISFFKAY